METCRLEYFLHIADAGSIDRAAQRIGMTQPGSSRQLSIFENELQSFLWERSPSGTPQPVPVPVLGQDTEAVPPEVDYDPGAIARLQAAGAV